MANSIWNTNELGNMSHHEKMKLFVISSGHDYFIPPALDEKFQKAHRLMFYLFVYRLKGNSKHSIDFMDITVNPSQLLFLLPHQVHVFPPKDASGEWFKMAIAEDTLAQLPTSFPFLLNPFNNQLININISIETRIKSCFNALLEIVHETEEKNQTLIISYLNTLLTELNLLYFKNSGENNQINDLSIFTRFKMIVDENLTAHPSIPFMASELNISEDKLYATVK